METLGGTLVAISPQKDIINKKMVDGRKLNFDILWDRENRFAHQLGIAFTFPEYLKELYLNYLKNNLPETNGDDSWTLPIPARYVIDQEGIIRSVAIDPDYKNRPEPSETLEALKALY